MKVIKVEEDVFKTDIRFVYNCSVKEFNKYLKSIKSNDVIPEELSFAGTLSKTDKGLWRIIFIPSFNKDDNHDLGVLAHEIFHLVVRVCEDKGVAIYAMADNGYSGDETAAYLMNFYFKNILDKVN